MNRHARRAQAKTRSPSPFVMTEDKAILGLTFGVHEAYRRIGIPAADIHIASMAGEHDERVMVVAHQGNKRFALDLGERGMPVEDYERQWKELVFKINDGTVSEAQLQVWFAAFLSIVEGGAWGLVSAMKAKGFAIGGEVLN